jgi:hypothetical protein
MGTQNAKVTLLDYNRNIYSNVGACSVVDCFDDVNRNVSTKDYERMAIDGPGGRGILKPVIGKGKRASQLMSKDGHTTYKQVAHSHQM